VMMFLRGLDRRVDSRLFFFFQAEDGIRDGHVTGVQTCALPICSITLIEASIKVMLLFAGISVGVTLFQFAPSFRVNCTKPVLVPIQTSSACTADGAIV